MPGKRVVDVFVQITNEGGISDDTSLEIIEEYPFTLEYTEDVDRATDIIVENSVMYLQTTTIGHVNFYRPNSVPQLVRRLFYADR